MPKKTTYTIITPIPSYIPRQLAIDMLHSHGEIIELNPLVLEYHNIKAPRDAPADEFFSTWYEITQRIQYIPGTGKLGSGKISFRGVFHDLPGGLQTHIYAPAGVDMRNKWMIKGNQPGEPPEQRELGSDAPADGLYLREDVEIRCNFAMVPFVKNSEKAANKVLVERMIKKAELIDAEILKQMMHANLAPGMNNSTSSYGQGTTSPQPQHSPTDPSQGPISPSQFDRVQPRNTLIANSSVLRKREEALRQSMYGNQQSSGGHQYHPSDPHPTVSEMAGHIPARQSQNFQTQSSVSMPVEMPGDYYHPPQKSPALQQTSMRSSTYSELSGDNNAVQPRSRSGSFVPDNATTSSGWGGSQTSQPSSSPRLDQNTGNSGSKSGGYRYNPRDFVDAQGSSMASR